MPTAKSDIYALGMILYQLVVGDFSASLAPGWEGRIADPVLRSDILAAAEGDPALRLASAADLADRLETIDRRRADASAAARRAAAAEEARRAEESAGRAASLIRAAIASLAGGFIASSAAAAYARHQRGAALEARDQAETSYAFIAEDVLSSPDPAKSSSDETVIEVRRRESANIDARYARSWPGTAARLHLAVARAFYQRSDFDTARAEYARAATLFGKAGEADSEDAAWPDGQHPHGRDPASWGGWRRRRRHHKSKRRSATGRKAGVSASRSHSPRGPMPTPPTSSGPSARFAARLRSVRRPIRRFFDAAAESAVVAGAGDDALQGEGGRAACAGDCNRLHPDQGRR